MHATATTQGATAMRYVKVQNPYATTYEVYATDGTYLGRIWKGWSRNGGEGWQSNHGGQTYPTRDAAARNITRSA